MKNLRGSILGTVPVLQGFRSANIRFRTFRRFPAFRSCKVTHSSNHISTKNTCLSFSRRYVSTGSRKSQMVLVGTPSKISVPPNHLEINKFISSVPGKVSGDRHRVPVTPRKLPINIPPRVNFGEFLSTSGAYYKNTDFDPFSVESAFFPTFQTYQEECRSIFTRNTSLNIDPKTSSATKSSEDSHISEKSTWESLNTDVTKCPENIGRDVKKEIVLPRKWKTSSSQERFQIFDDIHRFDESDAKNDVEKKDIGGFPYGDHNSIPTGQFIIHSDRSTYIINKELYITNRILDKLKKRDKGEPTDGEPSEPIVKTSSTCDGFYFEELPELLDNSPKLLPKRSIDAIPKCSPKLPRKSLTDTKLLPSVWPLLEPELKIVPEKASLEILARSKEVSASDSGCSGPNKEIQNNSPTSNNLPANIEFCNPSSTRLSPEEFRAFESRKNLYQKLVRNTPCYLVDGLHIQNASVESSNSHELPEESFSSGDSGVLSNRTNACEIDNGVKWGLPVRENEESNEVGDFVSEQPADLEEWFVPLGNEIDSMLTTLSVAKSNCRSFDPESNFNGSQKQAEIDDMDFNDFKDCADHIGVSDTIEVPEIHFEGLEGTETALLKSGDNAGTPGYARFNSSSTPPQPPNPPKQSNPNVDIKTETTIKCCRMGGNTDINVIETQRYLDKRLPYPFSTETVLQVYGRNDSLHKATQAVENSKSQLVHLSNANSPNPGMAIPKLQFNHMLSKTHEITNQNANNKKRILKIKTVSESPSIHQYSAPPNVSFSEPSSVSHVLQAPTSIQRQQQPTSTFDINKGELTKRSKFPLKTASKRSRRSESVKQLRSRKKPISEDIGENITVLGPKDLERMFPTPPKPKPVEKPRNVEINNKAANTNMNYNALNLVEAPKEISKITLKAKKTKDKWLLVNKKGPAKLDDIEGRGNPQAAVQVEKDLPAKKSGKSEGGLSSRDQRILESIVSHKVKDSFTAVAQREKNVRINAAHQKNEGQVRNSLIVNQQAASSKMNQKVSGKAVVSEDRSSPTSQAKAKLLESLFKGGGNKVSPPTYEDPKFAKASDIVEKRKPLDDSPIGLAVAREQVLDNTGKTAKIDGVPKRDVSPTPTHNREYLIANVDALAKPRTSEPQKLQEGFDRAGISKKSRVMEPTMGSVLPVNPKGLVENTTNTPDKRDASRNDPSRTKSVGQSSLTRISKQNVEQYSDSNVTNINASRGDKKSTFTETVKSQVQKMRTRSPQGSIERLKMRYLEPKTRRQLASPLFFPFEAPTVKELDQNISSPISPSTDPQVYETDFSKLGTESEPGLDVSSLIASKVPLSRVKEFPMVNEAKTSYPTIKTPISIKPDTDMMLRRTLSLMPAVTKVLGATLSSKSQQALDRWKQGLVDTIGEDGYKQFVENQLRQGSNFHSTVSKFLLNKMDCKDDLCMKSMANVFPRITDISVIESQVVHPQLAYRGVVDCVAKYKGKPVAIEWKRSEKAKPTIKHTYDAPLQLSAYIGALNFDNHYKLQVEGGLVVVAYSDGSPADVFEIPLEDCQRHWFKWLKRLYQFYSRT